MPRPPRIDVPGLPQHLVARGHNKTDCFHRELDRAVYLKYLGEESAESGCDAHAFVLMTNHVHLLVTGILANIPFHEALERDLGRPVEIVGPGRPALEPRNVI